MATESLGPLGRLCPLAPLTSLEPSAAREPAGPASPGSGFAEVLNQVLAGNRQANESADQAVRALATGDAQDLHTVTLAVAQADLSFRLLLEIRNRLTEAFQDVSRMQV